jgi:hypothetical protein
MILAEAYRYAAEVMTENMMPATPRKASALHREARAEMAG